MLCYIRESEQRFLLSLQTTESVSEYASV